MTTKQLESWAEVRDFVFAQLDAQFIKKGHHPRDDEDTWIEAMKSRHGEGVWIFRVHHNGDGTFTSTIGFRYNDDPDEHHWIGMAETPHPIPASDVLDMLVQAHLEVFLGVIEQIGHEEYDELTRTLPVTNF